MYVVDLRKSHVEITALRLWKETPSISKINALIFCFDLPVPVFCWANMSGLLLNSINRPCAYLVGSNPFCQPTSEVDELPNLQELNLKAPKDDGGYFLGSATHVAKRVK